MKVVYPTDRPFEVVRGQHNFHVRIERIEEHVTIGVIISDLLELASKQAQTPTIKCRMPNPGNLDWSQIRNNLQQLQAAMIADTVGYTSMQHLANDLTHAVGASKSKVGQLVAHSFDRRYSFYLELVDAWGRVVPNALEKQTRSLLVNEVACFRPTFKMLSEDNYPFTVRVRCIETGQWQDTEPIAVVPKYMIHTDRIKRAPRITCTEMRMFHNDGGIVRSSYTDLEVETAKIMVEFRGPIMA